MNDHFLDITADICPLTFVKTKLLIESMAPGEIARVRLKGLEPLENVPRSVREHGHEIVSLAPENAPDTDPAQSPGDEPREDTVYLLDLRKC
jgi:TusA-related sulfurtransferase